MKKHNSFYALKQCFTSLLELGFLKIDRSHIKYLKEFDITIVEAIKCEKSEEFATPLTCLKLVL